MAQDADTTTISVTQQTLDRFNQLKTELNAKQPNAPDHNGNSFLHMLMDTLEAANKEKDTPVDYREDIAEDVAEIITQELEPVIENAGVSQTPGVDGEYIVDEVVGRINDLEAELPRKVTEELQR